MLFLKQLVKPLVLSSAGLLHRTSHTKTFLLRAIFYLSIQCLPKVSSLHCIVPMPMSLSPVTGRQIGRQADRQAGRQADRQAAAATAAAAVRQAGR